MATYIGYLTTCVSGPDEGMQYIGIRKLRDTRTQDPWYMGSGKRLGEALRKHGKGAFSRHVMGVFSTRRAAEMWEHALTEFMDAVNNPRFYNVIPGGGGGAGLPEWYKPSAETREKQRIAATGVKQSATTQEKKRAWHKANPRTAAHNASLRRVLCRPVEVAGVRYEAFDTAVAALGVGRTTLKRWLNTGRNGARRLDKDSASP